MKINYFWFVLIIQNCLIFARVRKWISNTNVLNKLNWDGDERRCDGLIFPRDLGGIMAIDSLVINKIDLPANGEIAINDGASITFDENNHRCISVKPIIFKDWFDPNNWSSLMNKAAPHTEKIPCEFDEVFFPRDSTFAINLPPQPLGVRSITYQDKKLDETEWNELISSGEAGSMFSYTGQSLKVSNKNCSYQNCVCHENENYVYFQTCKQATIEFLPPTCYDSIYPRGYCSDTCGAYFLFDVSSEFNADNLMKVVKDNVGSYVDFYLSRVNYLIFDFQLVIADKMESTSGFYSVKIAKHLETIFSKDGNDLNIMSHMLYTSGGPIKTAEEVKLTFIIIFGALFATLLFFGIIYVTYVGPLKDYKLNVGKTTGNRSTFRPFAFARFENKDGGELTLERSLTSSIESLQKSFDNPMFGQDVASIASTSYSEPEVFSAREGYEEDEEVDLNVNFELNKIESI